MTHSNWKFFAPFLKRLKSCSLSAESSSGTHHWRNRGKIPDPLVARSCLQSLIGVKPARMPAASIHELLQVCGATCILQMRALYILHTWTSRPTGEIASSCVGFAFSVLTDPYPLPCPPASPQSVLDGVCSRYGYVYGEALLPTHDPTRLHHSITANYSQTVSWQNPPRSLAFRTCRPVVPRIRFRRSLSSPIVVRCQRFGAPPGSPPNSCKAGLAEDEHLLYCDSTDWKLGTRARHDPRILDCTI